MSRPPLIIPVENQVRELDPKLLLAAIAARRGFTSILGSHRDIDFRIASFPRGLYLNKSMTDRNLKMFQIMRRLGHLILTWDEEALVHLPPDIYYSRRLSPTAIRYVSHLFAWGEDNAALWRRYPEFPSGLPIHVTGNPRNDLLRPELHSFYADQVQAIRDRYGEFLLVNTNFNHVNAFFPAQNLFKPARHAGEPPVFGKAGVGMSREFAEALRDQKQAVFEAFLRLIPELARAFPGLAVVVRPHPTEGQDVYRQLAAGEGGRIHVTNEGNVVPWLMAARALVHNGCTTGVEAFVMRTPAFSYRPSVCPAIDDSFYRLPHGLSHQCFAADELLGRIGEVLQGRLGAADGDERTALVRRYLTGQDGALACERMMDVLEGILPEGGLTAPPITTRVLGRLLAEGRFLLKRVKSYFPGSHAPPEFHRHRYPDVTGEEMLRRMRRFQGILGDDTPIRIESIAPRIFRISPGHQT